MLRSKLSTVYFPNTIAKVSNSTVKSNTLVVFVCACVRVLWAHNIFFRAGGPSKYPGPGARGFLIRPCMHVCVCVCVCVCVKRVKWEERGIKSHKNMQKKTRHKSAILKDRKSTRLNSSHT